MEKSKERIFGFVVLIALAIIFVPMFLDVKTKNINVTETPAYVYQSQLEDLADKKAEKENHTGVVTDQVDKTDIADKADKADIADKELSTEEQTKIPKTQEALVEKTESTAHREEKTAVEAPVLIESKEASLSSEPTEGEVKKAWIVQIGTFGDPKNATALVKKLTQSGYPAYTREKRINGKLYTLVLVGPQINKADAQKFQKNLKAEFHLEGIVKEHRNVG